MGQKLLHKPFSRELTLFDLSGGTLDKSHTRGLSSFDGTHSLISVNKTFPRMFDENHQRRVFNILRSLRGWYLLGLARGWPTNFKGRIGKWDLFGGSLRSSDVVPGMWKATSMCRAVYTPKTHDTSPISQLCLLVSLCNSRKWRWRRVVNFQVVECMSNTHKSPLAIVVSLG